MKGVGDRLAPLLIAEIGDIRRFKNAGSLIAYAGMILHHINLESMKQQIDIFLNEVISI